MSSIQGYVAELKNINVEIKRLQNEIKKFKKRAVEVEKNILTYLNEKEQPGVKYQNTAIIIENKAKRIAKTRKDVESEALRILQNNGVANPQEVLKQITESRKGDKVEMQKVKIQNIGTL